MLFFKQGQKEVLEGDFIVLPVDGHAGCRIEHLDAEAVELVYKPFHINADHDLSFGCSKRKRMQGRPDALHADSTGASMQ